jgi:uncharacterized protein with ACT and thioredoxin-like domain
VGRRRPGAVSAVARGNWRGRRFAGQHVSLGGSLGSSEAIRAVGRRRARAGARAQGSSGNGGRRSGMARGGENDRLL